jgi:hypothetical protein
MPSPDPIDPRVDEVISRVLDLCPQCAHPNSVHYETYVGTRPGIPNPRTLICRKENCYCLIVIKPPKS